MSGEERENLGHLLNDILEPRVMTEAEAKFLESLPVAEFPLKRKGPAMNDQAETSELATLRAENKRLKAENLELLNDLAMLRKSDVVLAESERLRSRLAAAERFYVKSADGTCGIEITKAGGKWSVYITHYGIFGPYDGRNGLFESFDAAWAALVAAGWLPAAKGGE